MLRIQVENFSCITKADFTVGGITILIGPQASGKSVLSKLIYFFLDTISEQQEAASREESFATFTEELKTRFSEWFPISAWGQKKFKIQFECGEYKVNVTRITYNDSVNNTLRVWTSRFAKEYYQRALTLHRSIRQKTSTKKGRSEIHDFEVAWRAKNAVKKMLRDDLGNDFIDYQVFIPAGRSFFTNLGRAFMAFDQGRVLDPITIRFGRMYSSYYEEMRFLIQSKSGQELAGDISEILGGKVVWTRDQPMLSCNDGRNIPFSALSSGQQEILPLITALSAIRIGYMSGRDPSPHLIYIEEPEAHLFPSAQSHLVEGLSALVERAQKRRLVITTHSPYVLSKFNNLIKAGALDRGLSEDKASQLSRIIQKKFRIRPGTTQAYALNDGELKSIIDEDGLIAADYLDDISGEIAKEFSRLLELEYST